MKLFGSSTKKAPQVNIKDSVLKIRENIEMLEKREKFLQTKIDKEIAEAKANAQKNRRLALMALKRKKQYDAQIEKMMQTRMNLEYQLSHIDNAAINLETLNVMREGNKVLKQLHGSMTVEQVDDIMDDLQEQVDLANVISDVVSKDFTGNAIDEDELNAELEQLEQQDLDSKLLEVEAPETGAKLSSAPSVPTTEPVIRTKKPAIIDDEAAQLAELHAQMAM